ncbi:Signal recognition particle 19 kDa protein [Zea mays]|uniref:Signal recognition particle 19 kDa protein n=1 Tax=Zea mays TaxID=4577 RepID=A0A1D6DTY8_MAIZE|nr:Signal recognition particle 19 kDa protein [Zea mays]
MLSGKLILLLFLGASTFMCIDYQHQLYDCQESPSALSMHDFLFEINLIAALCFVLFLHLLCLDHFINWENLCVCFSLMLQCLLPFY